MFYSLIMPKRMYLCSFLLWHNNEHYKKRLPAKVTITASRTHVAIPEVNQV